MPRTAAVLGGGTVTLEPGAFEATFNMPLVHEAVRAELAARRRGTASTKTRGDVSGGGAKPWRQKGTGRARAGSSRSPVWTGGGTAFGPSPRSYTFKVNRKARSAAMRSALSEHAGRDSLAVFDAGEFEAPSTRQAAQLLAEWGASGPTLVLLLASEEHAGKSFRNLQRVLAMPVEDAGVADVIGARSLLVSREALSELVARARGFGRDRAEADGAPARVAHVDEPVFEPASEPVFEPASEPAGAAGESAVTPDETGASAVAPDETGASAVTPDETGESIPTPDEPADAGAQTEDDA